MTLVCAGPSKDHLLLKVSSSTGWKQMSEENYKHIGDRFAQVFLVSVQLQPRSFQAQNNAFMLIAFSGTQHKRGGTWSNLFYYILEPSELLAPTTSFLAPKAQGIFYLSIFFVEKEKFLFLAGSFICCPWFLVLKQVLVLPVLVQEDFGGVVQESVLFLWSPLFFCTVSFSLTAFLSHWIQKCTIYGSLVT